MNTTADWCSICANTKDRGCAALTLATEQGEAASRPKISSVGAGFLGAGLTLAVVALMAGTLAFLGLLTVGKFRKRQSRLAGVVRDLYICRSSWFNENVSSNSKKLMIRRWPSRNIYPRMYRIDTISFPIARASSKSTFFLPQTFTLIHLNMITREYALEHTFYDKK